MVKNYKVITLCGSTKFKDEFLKVQKDLTLQGNIVISVGLFGHSGDQEVWENMDEGTFTKTKEMLDDMHKRKIDMADEIFVINPNGYIGESTWSEICYAFMTGKTIDAIEPIDRNKIEQKVSLHIKIAEMHAARQYDIWTHLSADYPSDDFLLKDMAIIKKGKCITMDPWVPEDESIPTCDYPFIGHADKQSGYDPFKIYGKQKMARFIEEIIMRYRVEENC